MKSIRILLVVSLIHLNSLCKGKAVEVVKQGVSSPRPTGFKSLEQECDSDIECASSNCCPGKGNVHRCSKTACIQLRQNPTCEDFPFYQRKFKYCSSHVNWFQAYQACCKGGGNLADIRNEAEFTHLIQKASSWTGANIVNRQKGWGTAVLNASAFSWTTGESNSVAQYFASGQPNNGGRGESCCALEGPNSTSGGGVGLHDFSCHNYKSFLCVNP